MGESFRFLGKEKTDPEKDSFRGHGLPRCVGESRPLRQFLGEPVRRQLKAIWPELSWTRTQIERFYETITINRIISPKYCPPPLG